MHREEVLASWVPPDAVWSRWARPVLFAQMSESEVEPPAGEPWRALAVDWAPAPGDTLAVVDLPGAESVWMGLALAGRGYRPVPLFNACTGPCEVIDQAGILTALRMGAAYLVAQPLTD